MKKVVLKCRLKNHDIFKRKLDMIDFHFSEPYWQHDRIYVPRGYQAKSNFPRLVMRTEMKSADQPAEYHFILKRHIEDSGVDIVESTPVTDYEKLVNIILQLGFKPVAEVSRSRQALDMGEGTYIYLDKIENQPSYYAKIESDLRENDSVQEAREDLRKTFLALGENDIVESTYFELD